MINGRYELKYQLNFDTYYLFLKDIIPYFKKDFFTSIANKNKYFVKSLYFDNYNFISLNDKLEGEYKRFKLRLRCYNEIKEDNKFINVEIKNREGEKINKETCKINIDKYNNFIKYNKFSDNNENVLIKFNTFIKKFSLFPCVNIEYYREVYESKLGNDIRISFDHSIKSSSAKDLFNIKSNVRLSSNSAIIMEIKTRKVLPKWLIKLIKKNSLKLIVHSKYANGNLTSNISFKGSNNYFNNLNL